MFLTWKMVEFLSFVVIAMTSGAASELQQEPNNSLPLGLEARV